MEPPSGDVFHAGARDEIVQRALVGAMTAESQEPRWRRAACPNESAPPSWETTRMWKAILPRVWPRVQCMNTK